MLEDIKGDETKVTLIFPTKNEESTIERCIKVARESRYHPHIIVVDGFSVDKTREIVEDLGVEIIIPTNRKFPGKGIGMVTALKKALSDNPDIILFLDADIKNITYKWIDKLVDPIIEGRYDMVRGQYHRAPRDAAVTKLIARPLLKIFFPEIPYLEQPLSGEVAAKSEVWAHLLKQKPPDGWGVDIWFVIETACKGYSLAEVSLGFKEHTSLSDYSEDIGKLSKMGEQVALSIIKEAIKFDRIDNANNVSV